MLNSEFRNQILHQIKRELQNIEGPSARRLLEFILDNPGKLIRPAIILRLCEILGGNMAQAVKSSVALELLHEMSLIHDDIIDKSPLRRGVTAYCLKYGESRAIIDGDILFNFALKILDNHMDLRTLVQTVSKVSIGQARELEYRFTQPTDLLPEHILKIMELKTGIVFQTCLELACNAADRKDMYDALSQVFLDCGVLFQIQDDLIDFQESTEILGKVARWDIQESKPNLFYAFALNDPKTQEEIYEIFQKPIGMKTKGDIEIVSNIFSQQISKVLDIKEIYRKKTERVIQSLKKDENLPNLSETLDFLEMIIDFFVDRHK
ncbi:MAG: polyprenyl synthetase family protein [Candidatus Hodarchaeales archaeon]